MIYCVPPWLVMRDALKAVLIQASLRRIKHPRVTADSAHTGSKVAGNEQSSNTDMLREERRESRKKWEWGGVGQHKLGTNGRQLINPEKCNFWKENLFPARDQRLRSLVDKQVFETFSCSHGGDKWMSCRTEPWGWGRGGDSLSLPKMGLVTSLLSPVQVPAVCLIPITEFPWPGHPRAHQSPPSIQSPSLPVWVGRKELISTETQVIAIFPWAALIQ